jgi:hypothetical protein
VLPTIVIGADEATREPLLTRWREAVVTDAAHVVNGLWFYGSVEDATYALADQAVADPSACAFEPGLTKFEQDADGRWQVNVLWGPNAWALALTAQKPELAHTGWTGVFGAHVDDEPGKPRRVMDKRAIGTDPDTRMWQAAPVMRAHLMFDVFGQDGSGATAVKAVVERFASRETP